MSPHLGRNVEAARLRETQALRVEPGRLLHVADHHADVDRGPGELGLARIRPCDLNHQNAGNRPRNQQSIHFVLRPDRNHNDYSPDIIKVAPKNHIPLPLGHQLTKDRLR